MKYDWFFNNVLLNHLGSKKSYILRAAVFLRMYDVFVDTRVYQLIVVRST